MDNIQGFSPNNEPPVAPSRYDAMKSRAQVDLALKNIFLGTIVVLNLAALGSVYAYITLYCPIRTEPLIATSFVVGVIGGLVSLKVPTLGVNNYNLNQYLSPVTLMGRTLAYIFFGPALLVKGQMDWTKYSNSCVADKISGELLKENFEFFAKNYGPNINNLVKYGFISEENAQGVKNLYDEYKVLVRIKKDLLYYSKNLIEVPKGKDVNMMSVAELKNCLETANSDNPLIRKLSETLDSIEKLNERWETMKRDSCLFPLPEPKLPNYKHWYVCAYSDLVEKIDKQFNPESATA